MGLVEKVNFGQRLVRHEVHHGHMPVALGREEVVARESRWVC